MKWHLTRQVTRRNARLIVAMLLGVASIHIVAIGDAAPATSVVAAAPKSASSAPPYFASMPSVAVVKARVSGIGDLDTAARQFAAFHQLGLLIRHMSAGGDFRDDMTPEEHALDAAYSAAATSLAASEVAALAAEGGPTTGPGSAKLRWTKAWLHYDNEGFGRRVIDDLLPSDVAEPIILADDLARPPRAIEPIYGGPLISLFGVLSWLLFRFKPQPGDDKIGGYETSGTVNNGSTNLITTPLTVGEIRRRWLRRLFFGSWLAFGVGSTVVLSTNVPHIWTVRLEHTLDQPGAWVVGLFDVVRSLFVS